MKQEHQCLIRNKTWILVDKPSNRPIVPCKWIFKKRNADGKISRYKARLVAKGFSQVKGVDYTETFSPVVRGSTLRLLLALAAKRNMEIEHLDVDTAFLNGELEEEIFMSQLEGFEVKGQETKVCLLKKSIYGLKQASRSWNKRIHCVAGHRIQTVKS